MRRFKNPLCSFHVVSNVTPVMVIAQIMDKAEHVCWKSLAFNHVFIKWHAWPSFSLYAIGYLQKHVCMALFIERAPAS